MGNEVKRKEVKREEAKRKTQDLSTKIRAGEKRKSICDRCGFEMVESNCKIICPNCGNRFDCSDLNLYFD